MVVTRFDTIVELAWSDNSAIEDGYQVWLWQTTCTSLACPAFDPWCEYYGICGDQTILIAALPANSTAYTGPNPGSDGYPYNVIYVVATTKDGGTSDSYPPGFPR
jgi:hypothetical protein